MESLTGAGAEPEGNTDNSSGDSPLTPPALRRRWLTQLRSEEKTFQPTETTPSDTTTMSDNAENPKAGPFTIWTTPTAKESVPLITYPTVSPFTVWTLPGNKADKPEVGLISYPSTNPFTVWTQTNEAELISYAAASPFTVWTEQKVAAISVPVNNAFTVWAGKAPQPKVEAVAVAAAPVAAESDTKEDAPAPEPEPSETATPAAIASIFTGSGEDDDADEATAAPLGKTLLRWFAIPLVLLLGFIGFHQLNTEVKELTKDKNSLIGEKEQLTGDLAGEKDANEKLTSKNRTLDGQLTQTRLANKSLEEQAQDLKKEIGLLKGDVAKLKSDMADAITRHADEAKKLNATIKEKTKDIELKVAKISELNNMVATRDEMIKDHVTTIAAREKEATSLREVVKTANGRIAELQEKTQTLSNELDMSLEKANALTAMLTDTNKKLEASMAETKASAEKLRADLAAMKAQADTLTKEKSAAEKIAEEMKQKAAAAIEAQKKAEAAAAEAQKNAAAAMKPTEPVKAPVSTPEPTPTPETPKENIQQKPAVTPTAKAIFNGKDLTDWEGDTRLWSVVDGAIVGETNDTDKKIGANSFLIWKGGDVADFELTLKARITGNNNSGVQYRSKVIDAAKWIVGGYQMDMHSKAEYFGMLYEEKGRGIIAQRGQKVNVTAEGEKKVVGEVDKSKALDIAIWNDYKIVAKGNKITHFVNGDVTMELVDDQESGRSMKGVLAFQVHAGPGMKVEMKDVMLSKS